MVFLETVLFEKRMAKLPKNGRKNRSKAREHITLNVVVNTDVVAGYRLMLVNADGTETELSVGSGNGKSSFALNFANGAQIIHLVPIAE